MESLRAKIIRLAHINLALRPHLLRLVRQAALDERALVPMMRDLAESTGASEDARTALKMADAFVQALGATVAGANFFQDGPGADPSFKYKVTAADSKDVDVVVETIPMRHTHGGWDPPEDVTSTAEMTHPSKVSWRETVVVPLAGQGGLLGHLDQRLARLGVNLSHTSPRSLSEILQGYKRIVLPFVQAAAEKALAANLDAMPSVLHDTLENDESFWYGFRWPDGVSGIVRWKWISEDVKVGFPTLASGGFEAVVLGTGKIQVTDVSASIEREVP